MTRRVTVCLFAVLSVVAGGQGFRATCFAEELPQPAEEPDVPDLLPADTLAYARILDVDDVLHECITSPAFSDEATLRLIQGLQGEIASGLEELGFSRDGLGELYGSMRSLHLAIVGINYDEEYPCLVGVIELTDPKIASRVLADSARRRAAQNPRRAVQNKLTWDFRGHTVYHADIDFDFPIHIALKGSRLFFASDPFDLKTMLLGKKPDMALAQVPAYRQLSKRYESRKCFVFGNVQQGLQLLRRTMDTDDLNEMNIADNALGLRDIKAVGIGSSIGIKPNEAALEMTILLAESNPMRSLFRGATLDPTQHLKALPKGCFFGLFGNFTDPAATWQRVGKLFGEFDGAREFRRFRERSMREGIDIDELGKVASGPIGLFMVAGGNHPDDPSGAMAISVRDHNSLKTSLQKAIDANPRGRTQEIGRFEGRPVDGGDFGSLMIGPGYAFLGLNMGGRDTEATLKGIAAAE
ncbi:MAG: hypothetical protein HQ592_05175, partial [Planctomycetes bacterium]|nr:hypothetical protein [Planctomycetota bacterium]